MKHQFSYFEVHSDQPGKVLTFYADVFNVPVQEKSKEGGGLKIGDGYFAVTATPRDSTLPEFGVDVEDLEPYLVRLRAKRVEIEGPVEVESDGRKFLQVLFRDPDGRQVSLFQPLSEK